MYPDQIRTMAKGIETVGQTLKTVSNVLYGAIMLLNATAFIGFVGGTAIAAYLQTIQPPIDEASKVCLTMSQEVNHSVDVFLAL